MAAEAVSLEDQIAGLTADNDQKAAQIDALNQQLRLQTGFQGEAVASRETISELQATVDASEQTINSLRSQVSGLRADLEAAGNKSTGDDELVQAAKDVAGALKVLLGV